MAETQTRRILIKVDTSGSRDLKDIAESMGLLNKNTKSLKQSMEFLTRAFQSWVAFLGVRGVARMSDEMQNLSNRLKVVAGAGEDTAQTLEQLVSLANRTNQSISSVGDVYNRMSISLRRAGATSSEVLTLTENLINTFRVAGATTTETANTIVQLSQAFTSGELRGQELRSVMEQNGILADLLTKKFGQDIYKKAADGAIRITDILKILNENAGILNEQAKNLAPTFEQTLTKSMNSVSLSIGKLNEQFQLSAKFAKVMEVAVESLGSVLAVAGGVLAVWAASQIPALIAGLNKLRIAMIAFAAANPLLLAFTAITVAGGLIYANWERLIVLGNRLKASFLDLAASAEEWGIAVRKSVAGVFRVDVTGTTNAIQKNIDSMRKRANEIRSQLAADEAKSASPVSDPAKNMESLLAKLQKIDKPKEKLEKIKEILGDINKELKAGTITVSEYNRKLVNFELYKLNREFKEGKFDVFTYNERLRELELQELNRNLKNGTITLNQFNAAAEEGTIKNLNDKFEAGKVSLIEYNNELIKISNQFLPGSALVAGTAGYIQSIGTLSEQIAKGITQTFTHLEDNLVEFAKTGEFNFKKMAQSILDDLTRIIIRASIVKPLADGILSGFSAGASSGTTTTGGSYTDYSGYAAKGMAFDKGVKKFASGGIVDSPTAFRYGGGNVGLMGEAGTEAILPLKRGADGNLGVSAVPSTPVIVNIVNQAGAEVVQAEKSGPNGERILEVLIQRKVKDGLASGVFDKQLQSDFGLKRKGS